MKAVLRKFVWEGGRSLGWLVLVLVLCGAFSTPIAWAQQGNSAPTSGGDAGYAIKGEENPHPTPATYSYEAEQPDDDPQLYWSVVGAKTINGDPADSWPEGSLLVKQFQGLKIQWQDSIPGGRLALRTKVPVEGHDGTTETQERFFLWTILGSIFSGPCDADIQWSNGTVYAGGSPNQHFNFRKSGVIYDDDGFCWRNVQLLRFKNSFGINCFDGPRPYSWTFTYLTEQGHTYVENWTSTENNIYPQFYNEVPLYPFGSGRPQYGGLHPEAYGSFNTWLIPAPGGQLTTYTSSAPASPYAGEKIARLQISATGRGCGFLGTCGTQSTTTGLIVFNLLPPGNITAQEILSNGQLGPSIAAGQSLCVGRSYQVNAQADGAVNYAWGTNVGTISNLAPTGILDLTQVTPANAPFQVDIFADAHRVDDFCIGFSAVTFATFYFRDTPAPQNLRLDGNPQICSTPVVRTLRVDPVANATGYNWQILSGPGSFSGSNAIPNGPSSVSLIFTGPGTVQVQVTAQDGCNRLSAPITGNFSTADPNALPAPLPTTLLQNYDAWPWNFSNPQEIGQLTVNNPQSGIAYTFSVLDTELFNQKSTGVYYPSDPKSAGWGPNYVRLTQVAGGTSAQLELLDPRVASVKVRVTAYNGCGNSGQTQASDYNLPRPFHGLGLHRTAAGNGDDEDTGAGIKSITTTSTLAGTATEAGIEAGPHLYPNPAHDQLQIVTASPDTRYEYVVIVNAQGAVVQEARSTEGVQTLSLRTLPAGMYAVRLFDGKQFITQRITKE